MGALKPDMAATILVEAAYTNDDKVCAKYGISIRSVQRYRRRMASGEDLELAEAVARKRAAFDAAWAETLPIALREVTQSIAEIAKGLREDPLMRRNPVALERLAGALRLCADVSYTGKIIDASVKATLNAGTPREDKPSDSIFETDATDAGDGDFVT